MLQTMEIWGDTRSPDVFSALFGQPAVKRYRCMEVALNVQLFHVDLGVPEGDGHRWSRYVLYNFSDVAEFLAMANGFTVRLSLQTRLGEDRNYEIFSIKEILAVSAEGGRSGHFFVGVDGRKHPDSFWDQSFNRSITVTSSIWVGDDA